LDRGRKSWEEKVGPRATEEKGQTGQKSGLMAIKVGHGEKGRRLKKEKKAKRMAHSRVPTDGTNKFHQ